MLSCMEGKFAVSCCLILIGFGLINDGFAEAKRDHQTLSGRATMDRGEKHMHMGKPTDRVLVDGNNYGPGGGGYGPGGGGNGVVFGGGSGVGVGGGWSGGVGPGYGGVAGGGTGFGPGYGGGAGPGYGGGGGGGGGYGHGREND